MVCQRKFVRAARRNNREANCGCDGSNGLPEANCTGCEKRNGLRGAFCKGCDQEALSALEPLAIEPHGNTIGEGQRSPGADPEQRSREGHRFGHRTHTKCAHQMAAMMSGPDTIGKGQRSPGADPEQR